MTVPLHALDPSRRIIRIAGSGTTAFLQSILTANVETLPVGECRPGALLTPQGRILADMMICRREDEEFLLDCDATRTADLYTRLRRFRLRLPIDLECFETATVWIIWNTDTAPSGAFADPRPGHLGWRWIGDAPAVAGEAGNLDDWHARRIIAGVPQGPVDLIPERALMLEAGLDKIDAVDFSKGCYVGQEVTARTHYRGLVKRRIAPLRIDTGCPQPGAEIRDEDSLLGAVLSVAPVEGGAVCLAAMKLSDLHRIMDTDTALTAGDYAASLAVPDWMLPLPDPARTDSA